MKIVIVGGVAGGATAAARIRRLDEAARIVMFERSGYVSYANCGLPYYIGGTITDPETLTLQTPQRFWQRYRVDARVRHEVTVIHTERHTVSVRELDTGRTFEEPYDRLLLATGARPVVPALRGVNDELVFTLRTVEDTLRIRRHLVEKKPRSAVIVGGGFIGLEMAENLIAACVTVTLVERLPQVLSPLDSDMAALVHATLRKQGVRLLLGSSVAGFDRRGGHLITMLEGGASVEADMALLAIGVAPDTALASEAGLTLGMRGSVAVDEHMRTSADDVYAVGDAVEIQQSISGAKALIPLAGPANKQARIAADNLCGRSSVYEGALGSSVLKLFGTTIATTGLNARDARALGFDVESVVLSPASHASYFPGGRVMTMKVVFDRQTMRLLGAQILGQDGVDKRIDVLATALYAGLTAPQLAELDLTYAPPYSSAKDPVNYAGYIAENIRDGLVRQFHDVDGLPRDGSVCLLDARTPDEYEHGHAEGFRNVPLDELRDRLGELERDKPIYVMCQSGLRSYLACRILSQKGFDCFNFAGGYRFWQSVHAEQAAAAEAYPCGMDKPCDTSAK